MRPRWDDDISLDSMTKGPAYVSTQKWRTKVVKHLAYDPHVMYDKLLQRVTKQHTCSLVCSLELKKIWIVHSRKGELFTRYLNVTHKLTIFLSYAYVCRWKTYTVVNLTWHTLTHICKRVSLMRNTYEGYTLYKRCSYAIYTFVYCRR